ncbi:MAG: hypothetical protein IPO09_21380 [Anaeromyxobacter sp.]|nr:hypothetical protein [Anaeromyxobacter sp.]MBL0274687.1 hypothetical protein [Anaeromyxobacter sp.]
MTVRNQAAERLGQAVPVARVALVGSPAGAVARPQAPTPPAIDPVEALRRRLASKTAREHVVLDFLADDLREAREAMGSITGFMGRVEAVLADPEVSQQKLLALALGGGPIEQLEYLSEVLANLRRRVAQVAARM